MFSLTTSFSTSIKLSIQQFLFLSICSNWKNLIPIKATECRLYQKSQKCYLFWFNSQIDIRRKFFSVTSVNNLIEIFPNLEKCSIAKSQTLSPTSYFWWLEKSMKLFQARLISVVKLMFFSSYRPHFLHRGFNWTIYASSRPITSN